jgi:hypothetical protein
MTRPARAISTKPATASRLVTLFALLAFVLQGFAVQTHIHPDSQIPAGHEAQIGNIPASAPFSAQDPLDQGSCRLCQELLHSGVFLTPAPAVFLTAATFVILTFAAPTPAHIERATSFAWQSRAPPRR